MRFKILATSDNKYEGQSIDFDKLPSAGDHITLKEIQINIDTVEEHNNIFKLISSNYIIELKEI